MLRRILPILALLILVATGCQPVRRVVTEQTVTHTDTMHVTLCDTMQYVMQHDTTIVTRREYITEHIVTRYDPQSGVPTIQEVERVVQRMADSVSTSRIDSLQHIIYELRNQSSSSVNATHSEAVDPQLPWYKRMAVRFSSFIIFVAIIALVFASVKYYIRHNK